MYVRCRSYSLIIKVKVKSLLMNFLRGGAAGGWLDTSNIQKLNVGGEGECRKL